MRVCFVGQAARLGVLDNASVELRIAERALKGFPALENDGLPSLQHRILHPLFRQHVVLNVGLVLVLLEQEFVVLQALDPQNLRLRGRSAPRQDRGGPAGTRGWGSS